LIFYVLWHQEKSLNLLTVCKAQDSNWTDQVLPLSVFFLPDAGFRWEAWADSGNLGYGLADLPVAVGVVG
jgi:hypothetical protein